jgi:hypothetical protein
VKNSSDCSGSHIVATITSCFMQITCQCQAPVCAMKVCRLNGVRTAKTWQYMAMISLTIIRIGKPRAPQRADHMTRVEETRNA